MPDYIDREKALDFFRRKCNEIRNGSPAFYSGYLYAINLLKEIEREDAEPVVHAKLIESVSFESGFWVCSNCGFVSKAIVAPKLYNYCPNCGAKCDLEG